MRISDWSSDVCSSDLAGVLRHRRTSSGKRHAARVLAVSDERLPGVRVPVRDVWRARYPLRRWTRAEGTVRPAADRAQHVDVVAVVDYLRLRDAGDAAQPALCGADLAGVHRLVRPAVNRHGPLRVPAHRARGPGP